MSNYDLSGYILKGNPISFEHGNKKYKIQKYQGDHEGEYSIMEVEKGVENGKAMLFKKGILQMSWKMRNGEREGELTVYKKGIVDRILRWDDLDTKSGTIRAVVNDECGRKLLEEAKIDSGVVVYRGEFDQSNYKRDGFGIEYDKTSGVEKRCGYYRDDNLVHLHQEFELVSDESETLMEMTEYDGKKEDDNVSDCLSLHPVYVGSYVFDAKKFKFRRSGSGNVMNKNSGICERVCMWNGEGKVVENSECKLYNGWYCKTDDTDVGIDDMSKLF